MDKPVMGVERPASPRTPEAIQNAYHEQLEGNQEAKRLSEAVSGDGVMITENNLDGSEPVVTFVNAEICRITGYTAEELIGQSPRLLEGAATNREALARVRRELSAGRSCSVELVNYRKDGTPYDAELFVAPLLDETGGCTRFIAIHRNQSDRQRSLDRERRYRRVLDALSLGASLSEILALVVDVAEEAQPGMLGSILLVDSKHQCLRSGAVASLPQGYNNIIDGLTYGPGIGSCGTAAHTGQRVVAEDIATHPYWRDFRNTAEMAGLRACWSEPIRSADGDIIGTLAMYFREPRVPTDADLQLLEQCAQLAGIAIERARKQELLVEREERLRAILNAAEDAIITIDHQRVIIDVNSATEQMFGYTEDELVGKNVNMLMPSPYKEAHEGYVTRYLETGEARMIGAGREAIGRRKDGTAFPVDLTVSEVEHLALFTGIVRDVSARKKAEEALRSEQELSESMIDTAQNVVLVLDVGGRIVQFNPFMEELSGWKLHEVKGQDWFETFLPERERESIRKLFAKSLAGHRSRGNVGPMVTKDGREREIEWYDAPLTDADGQLVGLLCTGQDVTERRLMEREILEIAAEEQRRIGLELHDGMQQQLTGLGLLAQNFATGLARLSTDEHESGRLQNAGLLDRIVTLHQKAAQVQAGLEQAAREVNQLSRGLIPVELDAQGLMSSLTELARGVSAVEQMACTFTCGGAIEVANNFTATHLYRIAQEAINNALKHSGGNRISVSLAELDERITLAVLDNGMGIEEKRSQGPGMGLRIMAYRAELIGAALNVRQVDGGTEVTCTVTRR